MEPLEPPKTVIQKLYSFIFGEKKQKLVDEDEEDDLNNKVKQISTAYFDQNKSEKHEKTPLLQRVKSVENLD